MTLESIKNIIPSGFDILTTEFSDKQFYLIQRSGKNVVAKILIDIDQNSDINDIKKYQEKFISKDYFNSQGYLQWNYYLIFVRDNISNSLRKTIEQDESYTRKFVFNNDELKNYLQYVKTSSNEEDDIVGRWKNLLIKANLQEVFSDEKYTKAIDRFVNGETKKLEELKPIDSEPNKSEDFILDEVTNLSLKDNYRPFPEKRDFNFKKVNLICGPNGVGKTSLMEAVELMITGKNARNEKSNTADGSIEAQYEVDLDIKNDIFKYETSKYKARDFYWYNKTYSAYKTDTLFESFNRYNFYNSDSAYHLSNNSDNDLNKYLSAIALGTEFGAIRDRLKGFNTRLLDIKKTETKVHIDQRENIKGAKINIERLKEVINPEIIFKKFIQEASKLNWKKSLPSKIEEDTVQFENDYKAILSELNNIVHSKVQSESEVISKLSELKTLKTNLFEIHTKKKESEDKVKGYNIDLVNNQNSLNILNKTITFLKSPEAFKIETLDKDIESVKAVTNKVEFFFKELEKLELSEINNSPLSLSVLRKTLLDEFRNKEINVKTSEEQLDILKTTTDNLKSIIAEIKYYGKEFVKTKKTVDACPLCETVQTKSELLYKIEKSFSQEKSLQNIEKFNTNIKTLKSQLLKINSKVNVLNEYDLLLRNFYDDSILNTNLTEVTESIEKLKLKYSEDSVRLKKLQGLSAKLSMEGITFETFQELKLLLQESFKSLKLHPDSLTQIEVVKGTKLENIADANKKLIIENDKITSLNIQLKDLLSDKYDTSKYSQQISFDIKALENYKINFENLKSFIELKREDFIIELRHKLESLYATFKKFKEQLISTKELKFAQQIITKAEKKIKQSEPKLLRVKNGLKVINNILDNDDQEKVLNTFFRKNETEISEIFTQIHKPKEFTGLSIKDGQVNLLKGKKSLKVPISEISTGQRSALALSIFLALNKKLKKGPNLIIFDDPVTYTDDLNILSFLDYLRSIVINESRQLIFATASNKIASLFEKKFQFLQEDFNKFELSRNQD